MDKLATGSSKIEGMKEEAVKIKDCEHRYEIVKTPMKTTLMEIINDIFTTGTIPIRESSRGFIVPSNFKIDTEVDSEASITVSNCKEDNKFIRFENFRTETTVSPVSMFVFVFVFHLHVNYYVHRHIKVKQEMYNYKTIQ